MYASVPSAEQRLRHCWLKPAGAGISMRWWRGSSARQCTSGAWWIKGEVCQSAWKYWLFSIRRVDITVARTLSRCRCCAHRDGILPYSHCLPAPLKRFTPACRVSPCERNSFFARTTVLRMHRCRLLLSCRREDCG